MITGREGKEKGAVAN